MRRLYHRGTVSRIPRISTLRSGQRETPENNYFPLDDMTQYRSAKRNKKTVAFSSSQDLIHSVSSAPNTSTHQNEVGSSLASVAPDDPNFPLEQHAIRIVNEMEQDNTLMENNPFSEQRRLDTLREMPESLTMKRTIRKKLVNRVSQKPKGSPISFYKRLKYKYSMSLSKFKFLIKNMLNSVEFWYGSIKVIEGHYGSGVATFFRFFRWLFLVNCAVCFVSHIFVVIPQVLYDYLGNSACKAFEDENSTLVYPENTSFISEVADSNSSCPYANFSIGNIFTGEGFFTNTSLYYGHYTNKSWEAVNGYYYSIPMAYFFTAVFCYLFIFISLSVSVASSYRKSFIETMGGVKNIYAHRILCGWDFSIATEEGARLKSKCVYNELKELLSEESDKSDDEKTYRTKCHLIGVRMSVHIMSCIVMMFTGGVMWILLTANLGYDPGTKYQSSMMMSLIVTIIMIISPVIFSWIIQFEEYKRPRVALFVTLFRTYLLGMVVVGVLLAFWLKRARMNKQEGLLEKECWESSLGQDVYRFILMDFFIAIIGTALAEFVRMRIYLTLWENIGPPEFDIARNTLNLIYNETLFFVGFFFSPPLSLVIIIKMFVTFYIKKIGVLKNCQPSEQSWRAAQTHTVFLVLAFVSLLGVMVVYGYILTTVEASNCGPFRDYPNLYQMILEGIFELEEDHYIIRVFTFFTKPGVVAGILLGMCVGVYYLRAQSIAQMDMVDILRDMLVVEARDKEFLLKNISRVTQGEWLYGRTRCQILSSQTTTTEPTLSASESRPGDTSYSSSIVTQKVSEWLLKSSGSTTADIESSVDTSRVGQATRLHYKNIADDASSISDSSVPTSIIDINESQEVKNDKKPKL